MFPKGRTNPGFFKVFGPIPNLTRTVCVFAVFYACTRKFTMNDPTNLMDVVPFLPKKARSTKILDDTTLAALALMDDGDDRLRAEFLRTFPDENADAPLLTVLRALLLRRGCLPKSTGIHSSEDRLHDSVEKKRKAAILAAKSAKDDHVHEKRKRDGRKRKNREDKDAASEDDVDYRLQERDDDHSGEERRPLRRGRVITDEDDLDDPLGIWTGAGDEDDGADKPAGDDDDEARVKIITRHDKSTRVRAAVDDSAIASLLTAVQAMDVTVRALAAKVDERDARSREEKPEAKSRPARGASTKPVKAAAGKSDGASGDPEDSSSSSSSDSSDDSDKDDSSDDGRKDVPRKSTPATGELQVSLALVLVV